MDSSIKSLTITGSAAEDGMKPRRSGSRRKRTPDQPHEEGDSEFIENAKRIVFGQPQNINTMATPNKPIMAMANKPMATMAMPNKPIMAMPNMPNKPMATMATMAMPNSPMAMPNSPIQELQVKAVYVEGGKVILNPPRHQRVKLQPKVIHHSTGHSLVNQSRKARRIHLTNLTHRFTRAKRVHDDTEKKPMDSIREYLIQKGVIQAKSKAPEKMLRSMYSDFMLLKDQAL